MKQSYNRYFPTPTYLKMNSCALDISDQSIKYGRLTATPKGLKLTRYGQEKISPGVIVSGKINNEPKLVSILNDLRIREDIHFVRVSLPEEQMYLFTLTLPLVEQKDIRNAILLQVEEYIPLKAIDTVFDYRIISENNQNIIAKVIAIAKDTIESYLSVFKKAEIVPLSFELEAEAIARAVVPKDATDTVMIVDFGETRSGVSIFQDKKVLFTTTLDIGGINLTNMLAKNFSLSFEEAEKMKRSYGLDSNLDIDDIFPIILSGISVLRDELNKQYVYWQTHKNTILKNKPINHIILCGGEANLIGLAEYLSTTMKIKVVHADVWVNVSENNDLIQDLSHKQSFGYTTVIGLALNNYLYESESLVVNVLPEEIKNTIVKDYWMRFFTVALNLVAFVGLISSALLAPSYLLSKSKESFAENSLEVFNTENPDISTHDIDDSIKDINSKLAVLSKGKSPYQVNEKIIGKILSVRPSGIIFSQILFNENSDNTLSLEVHGVALNRTILRDFKTKLDNDQSFVDVILPISNYLAKSDINFTIKMLIK